MKNLKKLLAVAVVAAMIISIAIPLMAMADEGEPILLECGECVCVCNCECEIVAPVAESREGCDDDSCDEKGTKYTCEENHICPGANCIEDITPCEGHAAAKCGGYDGISNIEPQHHEGSCELHKNHIGLGTGDPCLYRPIGWRCEGYKTYSCDGHKCEKDGEITYECSGDCTYVPAVEGKDCVCSPCECECDCVEGTVIPPVVIPPVVTPPVVTPPGGEVTPPGGGVEPPVGGGEPPAGGPAPAGGVVPPAGGPAPAGGEEPAGEEEEEEGDAGFTVPDEDPPLGGELPGDGGTAGGNDNGGLPEFTIQDDDVPLAFFENNSPTWSLINLILAAAGIALAVMMGIRAIVKDRNEDDEEEQGEKRRNRKILAFAIPVLAILGTILFLLTQDMTLTMGMVDSWTLAQGALFAAGLLSYIFVSKKEKVADEANSVA